MAHLSVIANINNCGMMKIFSCRKGHAEKQIKMSNVKTGRNLNVMILFKNGQRFITNPSLKITKNSISIGLMHALMGESSLLVCGSYQVK